MESNDISHNTRRQTSDMIHFAGKRYDSFRQLVEQKSLVSYQTVYDRVHRKGWTVKRALNELPHNHELKQKVLWLHMTGRYTHAEIAHVCDTTPRTVRHIIKLAAS